jgi:tetratricopeptide (TPR) repeat protein
VRAIAAIAVLAVSVAWPAFSQDTSGATAPLGTGVWATRTEIDARREEGIRALNRGDFAAASLALEEAVRMAEAGSTQGPERDTLRRELSWSLAILARVRVAQRRHAEARELLERAIEIDRSIAGGNVNSMSWRDLGIALTELGDAYRNVGRYADAENQYQLAAATFARTAEERVWRIGRALRDLSVTYEKLAILATLRNDFASAAAHQSRAVSYMDEQLTELRVARREAGDPKDDNLIRDLARERDLAAQRLAEFRARAR